MDIRNRRAPVGRGAGEQLSHLRGADPITPLLGQDRDRVNDRRQHRVQRGARHLPGRVPGVCLAPSALHRDLPRARRRTPGHRCGRAQANVVGLVRPARVGPWRRAGRRTRWTARCSARCPTSTTSPRPCGWRRASKARRSASALIGKAIPPTPAAGQVTSVGSGKALAKRPLHAPDKPTPPRITRYANPPPSSASVFGRPGTETLCELAAREAGTTRAASCLDRHRRRS